ncbi:hypothetical protein SAMN05192534_10539 [Alteribacillus persepolensis]|uniref:Uncharacterized protein n=1 Tax=Alteribacillus persepolensis TaxID=568899 RepID=A0A1G8C2R0_9BACI|nr:hypothetical protein [Alteribacillus persepolensis]SDH39619.1 hypothetical protein SAMN05192534_10539 [Alteribacillus persepolensis]
MLTFEEKMKVITEAFPELTQKDVSLGRVNFQYEDSVYDKKNVVYHLHPNGNGYVYAGLISGYEADEKGYVNIRDFSEAELRTIIEASIDSLSAESIDQEMYLEEWINDNDQVLVLLKEGEEWNVYADTDLDGTFNSYPEAADYLEKEGFTKE